VNAARIEEMQIRTKIIHAASIHPLGDTAVTVEFGDTIDRALNNLIFAARSAIAAAGIPGIRETVPTFRALAVHFAPDKIRQEALIAALGDVELPSHPDIRPGKTWQVPVLYDGPDLGEIAHILGMSAEDAAALHASVSYHVYMLGFLPGFAYLGDLPERLRLPRLKEPRTRVPKGSVAIADQLTAIYPSQSPGGWRLIGRTPLALFDHTENPPSLFQPGDEVSFHPIGPDEFERLVREART
jgi:KipI family sensor histidine kinase inhibitor